MSCGSSGWLVPSTQRSKAILKTAIPASAVRLAAGSPTPRWRSAPASAVADEGVPIRAIAEVIGGHLNLPVAAIAPEDVAGHFTWLASFLGIDAPASSALTRELLGWQPVHPGIIDDLDKGHYFHG